MQNNLLTLYRQALPSFRSGVFFNTYAYPTKIAPESIAVYIATHTDPGETVLDLFSGSGATGLAAQMCEHPTQSMLSIAEKLGVDPKWGPRNAILYDISTYGTFATRVMTNPPSSDLFVKSAEKLIRDVDVELGHLYQAKDDQGHVGTIRHIIWSSVLTCRQCGRDFTFYEGMVSWNPLRIDSNGKCPHCGARVTTGDNAFSMETKYDALLGKSISSRRRIPVLVYGETNGRNWRRTANAADLDGVTRIEALAYPEDTKPQPIEWGELYRAGYHSGISHLHHFYTKRNFLIIEALWRKAADYENDVRDALRLLILSYNATHATLMTRVVAKHNSSDFVLTGAQSGVLYVSNLPVEKNIFKGLQRKIKPFARAFSYINGCTGHVKVINQSSDRLQEDDRTISYVFTDPPFGDFIPYAEVNQINELWLDATTDRTDEAIISPSQDKDANKYSHMIMASLAEAKRVLKDDGLMTLVFHSSKADVWQALASAIEDAGLDVVTTTHLAKSQESFKQVVSTGSVKGDSLILLGKTEHKSGASIGTEAEPVFYECPNDPYEAYASYVNHCLENGLRVELDARDAYERFTSFGAIT
ncbi:site-specific DNA-methyltransferase [Adlercreutzia sp. ZJ141]|uniref:site-specific DNA-methyltransferase n=1 Tax=Adlercreutzia sp. ZJ141 TaxID=2709406 RepID=UPI0013EE3C85|nr:site-specific DNA-methyltransferase [Adlercreutzia sp. ZJ141]